MKKTGLFLILILCLCNLNTYAARYYVKPGGDDATMGTSWESAFATLTKASSVVESGDEVWVAWGDYQEYDTITIPNNVSFYGGFAGTETYISQRDLLNFPTVVDGNDSHYCMKNSGFVNGFHITKGRSASYGGGINNYGTVESCKVYRNKGKRMGGGIYNSGTVINCIVYDNNAEYVGGIYNEGMVLNSTIYDNQSMGLIGGVRNNNIMTNCVIYSNKAINVGGISNSGILKNCIIYGNQSKQNLGGIENYSSIVNCTIYNNTGLGIRNNRKGTVTNSISWLHPLGDIEDGIIQYSCYARASYADGNFSSNPFFLKISGDLSTWDFHLRNGSRCIDAGTTDTLELPDTDIEGNPRPGGDGKVCIGAYESPDEYLPGEQAPPRRLYVKPEGDDNDNGTSWGCALKTIKNATEMSFQNQYHCDIWVAEGTYQDGGTIFISSMVSVFGGFDGSETEFEERDILSHQAIIDGMKKSHRCVENHGVIDGFHITRGKRYDYGGGIYNYGIAANSKVYGNQSDNGGGIYNLGEVINCVVYDNLGEKQGGGIYNKNGTIGKCAIFNNQANEGGGIYNLGKVTNCSAYNNQATNIGGGIANEGTVTNCTVYRNKAFQGSGIYCYSGEVVNCISWKNDPDDINLWDAVVQYCCFGGASNDNGNFSAIPLFSNTSGDISTWDFHLQNGSPCIDAGTTDTTQLPEMDMDGNARPGGDGKVCMGAYESPDEFLPGEPSNLIKRLYVKTDGNRPVA